MVAWLTYLPAGVMTIGAAITLLAGTPRPTPLARPLDATLPSRFAGAPSHEVPIGPDEQRVSGVTDYLYRGYDVGSAAGPLLLYVGYHATQQGDNRMHSPSLCLPGAGWAPSSASVIPIRLGDSTVWVNRYLLQKDQFRILVYYWFQGRGRVTAGETQLKIHSMVDALLTRRDEEALVRIVVPVDPHAPSAPIGVTGLPADSLAVQLSKMVIPALQQSLPPAP
jgi:EpsI family protein